jgi:hypothetical protein
MSLAEDVRHTLGSPVFAPHGQHDAVEVVDEAVEDGVGGSGFADDLMPGG